MADIRMNILIMVAPADAATTCRPADRRKLVPGWNTVMTSSWPAVPNSVAKGHGAAAQPAIERSEWPTAPDEGTVDRVGLGVVDERAKKFSPAERRIAEYLARGGLAVVSVSEGFGIHGRTPDARADDVPVEFKSLDPGASDRTVKAALNSAKRPGPPRGHRRPRIRAGRGPSPHRHPAVQRDTVREQARRRSHHRG
jgi:hypothetical protein